MGDADYPDPSDSLNASSLLELRAEILKKKLEFERERDADRLGPKKGAVTWLRSQSTPSKGKKEIPTKRPAPAVSHEEAEAWEKSRKALEAKSAFYDKLKHGQAELEGESLVDFDRKGWDEERKEYVGVEEELPYVSGVEFLRRLYSCGELNGNSEADGEIIEYTDEFGRTRMVTRTQLAQLEQEREEMRGLLAKYMQMGQDEAEQQVNPVHYDPALEVRTRGVGFFTFARNEEERQRQMNALRVLRDQTTEARTKTMLAKEKRRLDMEVRLLRIQRRRECYGIAKFGNFQTKDSLSGQAD